MENDSATKVQAHAQQAEASYQNQELGANAKTETEAATTKVVSVHLAEPESIFPLGWVVGGGGGGGGRPRSQSWLRRLRGRSPGGTGR